MAEAKTLVENYQSLSEQIIGNQQVQKNLGEQLQKAWSAEDKFIDELHDYMEAWCDRRHEAAAAAMDYAQKLTNGAEGEDIQKAWSDLSSATMKRLSEDTQAHFALMQKMATAFSPLMGPLPFAGGKAAGGSSVKTAPSNGKSGTENH